MALQPADGPAQILQEQQDEVNSVASAGWPPEGLSGFIEHGGIGSQALQVLCWAWPSVEKSWHKQW